MDERLLTNDGAKIKEVWCARGTAKWEVLRRLMVVGVQEIKSWQMAILVLLYVE